MDTAKKVIQIRREDPCLTLQEIGDKVHVSRERVRQILEKAKLKTRGVYVPLSVSLPHKLTVSVPLGGLPYKPDKNF